MANDTIGYSRVYTDNDWGSPLEGFYVTDISVSDSSRVIESPVELGTTMFDNKVLDPIKIRVEGYIKHEDFDSVITKIEDMAWDRSWNFYSVVTKSRAYKNLILKTRIDSQKRDMFDVISYTLEFVEVLFSEVQESVSSLRMSMCYNVTDGDTKSCGGISKL